MHRFSSSCPPTLSERALTFLMTFVSLGILTLTFAATVAAEDASGRAARNVSNIHFFSQALNENRAVNVILPLDYETSTSRYPVLYLLHGYTGNNTDWSLLTNLSEYAARYRLIVIMPDGSNGWYVNSAGDPKQKFEDYIIKDLISYAQSHYRTIPLRRARAIAGLSMGGYGAMFLGLKHYELFTAIGTLAGRLEWPTASFRPRVPRRPRRSVQPWSKSCRILALPTPRLERSETPLSWLQKFPSRICPCSISPRAGKTS